jgi:hypothetical protein
MNTTTENSAAAFSKVADQETNNLHLHTDDLRLYNDDLCLYNNNLRLYNDDLRLYNNNLRLYNNDLRLYNDDLRLYNDDFLNRLQALAKFRDRVHKTHQQVHVPELNRRPPTTFSIGSKPWPSSRIAHTRRTSRYTYQNSTDVFSPILIYLYRAKTRLHIHQKLATIAVGGGDVDGAASRVVDEVAATEMAWAVVGLERLLERRRRWLVRYTATLIG